jgi:uncharacterized protein YlxW (UPF0749 family)
MNVAVRLLQEKLSDYEKRMERLDERIDENRRIMEVTNALMKEDIESRKELAGAISGINDGIAVLTSDYHIY